MSTDPEGHDPRELALQLAIVAGRLDERSARAVQRVEAVAASFAAEVARMSDAVRTDSARVAAAQHASLHTRMRASPMISGGLFVAAVLAAAAALFTVASAQRDLASIARDQDLLEAINRADVTSCGGRLCARLDGDRRGGDADGYRRIALRPDPAGP